jgi:hypothetical protein
MAKPTITLALSPEDAEPILREAAREAALYGAWCDYITRNTVSSPFGYEPSRVSFDEARKGWLAKFLRGKRMVEAFGFEYEPTNESETMDVHFPMKNEKRKRHTIPGFATFTHVSGGEPDYKNPQPAYRRAVHAEACRQAADRVVRRWRATL